MPWRKLQRNLVGNTGVLRVSFRRSASNSSQYSDSARFHEANPSRNWFSFPIGELLDSCLLSQRNLFVDLIQIQYKEEKLTQITGDNLMKLIWHIGNRHLPCQIEKNRILIHSDDVINALILKLGGEIKNVIEPFNPEGGAYGIGRTQSHKH